MNEVWKPVVGYPFYEVSTLGRVRGLIRRKVLRPKKSTHKPPRLMVQLYFCGIGKWKQVHCLVLEAFVGPRPEGFEACHGDGDPGNCTVGNLRWDTHLANMADKERHGRTARGDRHGRSKITEGCVDRMRDMRRAGCKLQAIANWFGLSRPQTGLILSGKERGYA